MTKKYCQAICVFIFLSHFTQAQIGVGVKGGLNINRPIGGEKKNAHTEFPIDRYDLHTDFHLGITADFPVTKRFHVRPDLLFSRRVAQYERTNRPANTNFHQRMAATYWEIPVNFVYYHQGRHLNFYLGGGPYFGYVLSGKATAKEWKIDGGWDNYMFVSNELDWNKKSSFGAVVTAGLDLPFGMIWEFSVHRGFDDVNKSKVVDSHNKLINFNYGLSIGYLFGKKRT